VDTDNFVYRKVKDYADSITADYKCVKYDSIKCPGHALVNKVENKIEKVSKHDNHSTEIHKEQAKEVVQAFVQHAATNTMVISRRVGADIIQALQTSSAPDSVHAVPNLGCITKQRNRARKMANVYPKVPSEVAELKENPDMFRTTSSEEPFLIFNDWLDDEKAKLAMIFMSEQGWFILSNSS
jgi:hypothetical protein